MRYIPGRFRRAPGHGRPSPWAASGEAGHFVAQQAPDFFDEWSRRDAATTGDRVNCQQWVVIDRTEREGPASDLIPHRDEWQNGVAVSVTHHLFGERHAIHLLNLSENDATAKRRAIDQPAN